MHTYKITIKKVSGRMNESALPNRQITFKSKTKRSKQSIFNEASRYLKKKFGLVLDSANISEDDDINEMRMFVAQDISSVWEEQYWMPEDNTIEYEQARGYVFDEIMTALNYLSDSEIKKMYDLNYPFNNSTEIFTDFIEDNNLGKSLEDDVKAGWM